MAPRTVDDLFEEFMSHVAPDKLPSPVTNVYDLPPTLDTLVGLYREQQWQQLEAKAWSMLSSPDPEFNLHVHLLVDLQQNAFDLTPENATEWQHIVSTNLIHSFLDRKKFDVALRLATALYNVRLPPSGWTSLFIHCRPSTLAPTLGTA
ncbi:hypothetical protein DYB32_004269 [Aphanomyces invadans]|uniref:Uncharacterized protein n=1 Tax=Aphanomyces invadans TaxID=157072 RepID=A0A418AY26_9STRA|nr:hypothetical protein DYB32_004269 [Aphanomyces invadans]